MEPIYLDHNAATPIRPEVVEATGSIEGIALPSPTVTPSSEPTGVSAVLMLIDTSDPRRKQTVARIIGQVKSLIAAGADHHRFGLATFDSEIALRAPIGSSPEEIRHTIR